MTSFYTFLPVPRPTIFHVHFLSINQILANEIKLDILPTIRKKKYVINLSCFLAINQQVSN